MINSEINKESKKIKVKFEGKTYDCNSEFFAIVSHFTDYQISEGVNWKVALKVTETICKAAIEKSKKELGVEKK